MYSKILNEYLCNFSGLGSEEVNGSILAGTLIRYIDCPEEMKIKMHFSFFYVKMINWILWRQF